MYKPLMDKGRPRAQGWRKRIHFHSDALFSYDDLTIFLWNIIWGWQAFSRSQASGIPGRTKWNGSILSSEGVTSHQLRISGLLSLSREFFEIQIKIYQDPSFSVGWAIIHKQVTLKNICKVILLQNDLIQNECPMYFSYYIHFAHNFTVVDFFFVATCTIENF